MNVKRTEIEVICPECGLVQKVEVKENTVVLKPHKCYDWNILIYDYLPKAIVYATNEIKDQTVRRLVITEFFHSLNRKKVIPNEEVEKLISLSLTISECHQ